MEPKEETLSDIFDEKNYINEAAIQEAVYKHGGIEFSYTGELIPVEIVEVAIGEFVKKFRDKVKINGNLHTESCDECNKIKRTDRHEDMIFEIIDDCLGEKFKCHY